MTKEYTYRELIEAQLRGEIVEYRRLSEDRWLERKLLVSCSMSEIDEEVNGFRVKPTKPSIDWNHVSEEFNYLAIDEDGQGYLFADKPTNQDRNFWFAKNSSNVKAIWFSSFKAGDWDWKDSIVERPKEQ